MESLFLTVLNMSITAGWLVLAVMVLRLFLKKAPKAISVLMWALVGIRLLCPLHLESNLSLLPSAEPVPQEFLFSSEPHLQTGIPAVNQAVNPVLGEVLAPLPDDRFLNTPARSIAQVVAIIWVAGAVLMLLYALVSYLRIRRKVREGMQLKQRLWVCDRIAGPFILGILRPRIYLPSDMDPATAQYVIAHEQAHLKRKDHWWKPLGFLLLSIHWFNPLLWLGYIFLCRDIELACDEAVLRKLGIESKKPYSEALLNCSISRRTLAACPLAFGEVGVKTRIKSVLNYKKPALWIILAAAVTCAVLAVCFLTNPKTGISPWAEACLNHAVVMENRPEDYYGIARRAELEILGSRRWGRRTTYYLWVYYGEYTQEDGLLYTQRSVYGPAVITLREDAVVTDYWTPREDADHRREVQRKFPRRLWDEALNTEYYVNLLKPACEEQAWMVLGPVDRELTEEQMKAELETYYSQYFTLDTSKGLEVYVWQMAENSYRWGLMPGSDRVYTQTELMKLAGVNLERIQYIVASYGLSREQISVHPMVMPHSSYHYTIDAAYQQKVEQMFWGEFPGQVREEFWEVMDTAVFDIDGDGRQETCTIGPGPTSGIFSFTLTATEQGKTEYSNVFTGMFHDLSFEQISETEVCLRGLTQSEQRKVHYFNIGVDDIGNITLDGTDSYFTYWAPQNSPSTTEPELTLAISAAIQNRYHPQTEGNLCTQSYCILSRHWGIGNTPVGNVEQKDSVTVCLAVLSEEYSLWADFPENIGGHYTPAYITFAIDDRGGYTLTEYCDDYHKVMEKIPDYAKDGASGKYMNLLVENCDALALDKHRMQQGMISESYGYWKQRYDLAMEIRISSP